MNVAMDSAEARSITIRKANYDDLAAIRLLPLQLTNRPSSAILHKHYRVLVLEARTRLLIVEVGNKITAFMALRKLYPEEYPGSYLAIVHLGIYSRAGVEKTGKMLLQQAEQLAKELNCAGLHVSAAGLPAKIVDFYDRLGFQLHGDRLVRSVKP